MRLRHADGSLLHLAYCSNVHPADDLDGVSAQLERYTARVRERLDVPSLGIGLWVAAPALADVGAADRLAEQLDRLSLEVVTLNGFPYKAFHADVVKTDVYWPHWAEKPRQDYTLALARLLAKLLPDDVHEGSISTLPLGWREGWTAENQAASLRALADLASELEALERETGKKIRIAMEPEPGCTIETVAQAAESLRALAPEWIGVCLDSCHLAVQFETGTGAVAALEEAGLAVVKTQVSSALRVDDPASEEGRELLARFDEPKFLHQTREIVDARVQGTDDLPEALEGALPAKDQWRVHFHVPVNTSEHTTQDELLDTLGALAGANAPVTRHYEVETYTWSVMRDAPTDDEGLVAGLASELEWTRDRLVALGAEVL
ncbi:metabolite traffic protein EboE [Solirubrobacter sp. CPCC 204708]|uniref:Metabolite traffic protein EboE n=1 Tax=Solirubrobacter deserti TaxID=2282478 RepID=A0ABT4RLZ4_9ACTN|nr:metabolite traffic protein EboE [Solirubrobacter deserti]MBE2314444.1 metabolite traffic protein EboE [Solirubrobacter deserti]MDA0139590.1 metabolite traffic protein EboE [Solirubrobacter deserti]